MPEEKQGLYRSLARYYDPIYSWKDYRCEAGKIQKLAATHGRSGGCLLLDAACGTGSHLEHLSESFDCTGIDLNPQMLRLARKKVPRVSFKRGGFDAFSLRRRFDVVTCLFGSIAYTRTERNLTMAIRNLGRHVKPGGLLMVESFLPPSSFKPDTPYMNTYDSPGLKVARFCVPRRRGDVAVFRFQYLVGEQGKEVRHYKDCHEMGLFEHETVMSCMEKAGFRSRLRKTGIDGQRPLFLGMKPKGG